LARAWPTGSRLRRRYDLSLLTWGFRDQRQARWPRVNHESAPHPNLVRDYRAGGFPGRRRIRRAPRRRAPRNTTMPMNSKNSRPLPTTPTRPSTIATITRSRKKASIGCSAQSYWSAAGQLPFTAGAWLICQAVMLEDGRFVGRWQLAVGADRGRILHLLPVVSDLEVSGTQGRLSQGNEHEPVPGRHPDLDGAERWQVCAHV